MLKSNNLCTDKIKKQMPPLMIHPITLAVTHAVILDRAKFQLGISFFSLKKERKKTDNPIARMPAPCAIPISVNDFS